MTDPNAQRYEELIQRRSGRTTNMMRYAIQRVKNGVSVHVIAIDIPHLVNVFAEVTQNESKEWSQVNKYSFQYCNQSSWLHINNTGWLKQQSVDWINMRVAGFKNDSLILDHTAVYEEYSKWIELYHKWDNSMWEVLND